MSFWSVFLAFNPCECNPDMQKSAQEGHPGLSLPKGRGSKQSCPSMGALSCHLYLVALTKNSLGTLGPPEGLALTPHIRLHIPCFAWAFDIRCALWAQVSLESSLCEREASVCSGYIPCASERGQPVLRCSLLMVKATQGR